MTKSSQKVSKLYSLFGIYIQWNAKKTYTGTYRICDATCQNETNVVKIRCWVMVLWNKYSEWLVLSYEVLIIFVCQSNQKLHLSEQGVVLIFCIITELRKNQLKIEIKHIKKEYWKLFFILKCFVKYFQSKIVSFLQITHLGIIWY